MSERERDTVIPDSYLHVNKIMIMCMSIYIYIYICICVKSYDLYMHNGSISRLLSPAEAQTTSLITSIRRRFEDFFCRICRKVSRS